MKRTFSALVAVLILICTFLIPATQRASAHSSIVFRQSSGGPQLNAPLTPQSLSTLDQTVFKIKQVEFTPDGGWIVLYGVNGYSSVGVPTELNSTLDELNQDSKEIHMVAFTADGGWIVISGAQGGAMNGYNSKGLPQSALDKLAYLNQNGYDFQDIAFNPDNEWVILYGSNRYAVSNQVPTDLPAKLDSLINEGRTLKQVTFANDGSWLILYNDNRYAASGVPSSVTDELKKLNSDNWPLTRVSFTPAANTSSATDDATPTPIPDAWVILYGENGVIYSSDGMPSNLVDKLKDLYSGIQ